VSHSLSDLLALISKNEGNLSRNPTEQSVCEALEASNLYEGNRCPATVLLLLLLIPTPINGAFGSGWGKHRGWCKSRNFPATTTTNQDSTSSRLLPGSSSSCCIRNLHALVHKQCHPVHITTAHEILQRRTWQLCKSTLPPNHSGSWARKQ
jgi:hypothetical protein